MANPEILPQQGVPPEVQQAAHTPEIPAHVEQSTGMQTVQSHPQQLQQDGQVVAQPVAAPPPLPPDQNMPTVTIPAQSHAQLEQMSKGNPADTSTWFGVEWLRAVKQAVVSGKRVIFGQ